MPQNLQTIILKTLTNDEGFCRKVIPHIKGEYFEDQHQAVYDLFLRFIGKYNKLPTPSVLEVEFQSSEFLTVGENHVYWIVWFAIVLTNCIIFLNFIIAEASNSYATVKERLTAFKNYAKSKMIVEAEGMIFQSLKTNQYFPKYIVIRQVEV